MTLTLDQTGFGTLLSYFAKKKRLVFGTDLWKMAWNLEVYQVYKTKIYECGYMDVQPSVTCLFKLHPDQADIA